MSSLQYHLQEGMKLRFAFWKSIGKLDPDVLAPIINPAFMGRPAWPSLRQSFLKIRTDRSTIIASDGLSDPYRDYDTNPDNQGYNGLGLEFYIETPDPISDDISELKFSWQFSLLAEMCDQAAHLGNLLKYLQKYKYISMELPNVNVPEKYLDEHGRCGVLLGLPAPHIQGTLPLSIETIQIVNIRLLKLAELKTVLEQGEPGRNALAEKFIQKGNPGFSSIYF
jgi:hypothetical protein